MYSQPALKSYFDTLMSGYEFFKMVEMTKRRPNAYGVLEQGQKIAGQILVMSQGATVEQVQSNPSLRIEEPNAFAIPGVQAPLGLQPIQPQPVDSLAVLTDSISKLTDKVEELTSHSKRQHSRLKRLEDDRPPVTV
jgi:hypothetical protein